MDSKKALVALAVLFTIVNGSIVLGANEPGKNVWSSFGSEDHDPDGDGIFDTADKCPTSPSDLVVINKTIKKKKVSIGLGTGYVRITGFSGNNVTIDASSSETFEDAQTKSYTLSSKITAVDVIGKRMKILYSNSEKGFVLAWVADLEGATKGCTINEYARGSAPEATQRP